MIKSSLDWAEMAEEQYASGKETEVCAQWGIVAALLALYWQREEEREAAVSSDADRNERVRNASFVPSPDICQHDWLPGVRGLKCSRCGAVA